MSRPENVSIKSDEDHARKKRRAPLTVNVGPCSVRYVHWVVERQVCRATQDARGYDE